MILDQDETNLAQPHELSDKEKDDAMGAYLMMFASLAAGLPLPVINLIASVIYYFVNRDRSAFVHFHALQSLLSQIPTSLLNAGLVFWTFSNIIEHEGGGDAQWGEEYLMYLAFVIVMNLLYVVFSLIAAVRARKGRYYYFIVFGKMAFDYVNGYHKPDSDSVNLPPR
ncbi:MAG: DUF4870 domain-containing protein [Flavobacteriales bacterium]|nr:DUF4870 domain-containing protein [Flavobacteriales bacterium]